VEDCFKLKSADEMDQFMEELAAELNGRRTLDSLEDCETVVLAIDGYKEMFDAIDDKTAARLSALVRMGKGLGVYLIATETADRINILYSVEPTIKTMVSEGIGILSGGAVKEHGAFAKNLDYTSAGTMLSIGEFCKIEDGQVIKFKGMQSR
jgi:hypothetical protein